jgi:hypothetical protein
VTIGIIIGLILVASGAAFFIFASYNFIGVHGSSPWPNVAVSNPVCSTNSGNCVFILENFGKQCELTNISLYLHGDTIVAQTISDVPWGMIKSITFDSTLAAHTNQTQTIPFPSTLQNGSVIYYQIGISNDAETIFGPVAISS